MSNGISSAQLSALSGRQVPVLIQHRTAWLHKSLLVSSRHTGRVTYSVAPPTSDDEGPVPHVWRATFEAIVAAFVAGDWELASTPSSVQRLDSQRAADIEQAVARYGDVTLVPLEPETWDTSVCQWSGGSQWGVLVDLRTKEEGLSDLVLDAIVSEEADGYHYRVHFVYVP